MALTIRLTEDQRTMLQRLMSVTGIPRYSRLLMFVAAEHERLLSVIKERDARILELEQLLHDFRSLRADREVLLEHLASMETGIAQLWNRAEEMLPRGGAWTLLEPDDPNKTAILRDA